MVDANFSSKGLYELERLRWEAGVILDQEVERAGLVSPFYTVEILDAKTVGVQGDGRVYGPPAQITLIKPSHIDGKPYTDQDLHDFLAEVSRRMTNEVKGLTRVTLEIPVLRRS